MKYIDANKATKLSNTIILCMYFKIKLPNLLSFVCNI